MRNTPTPKNPAPQDWHKADIKAALERAGYTLRGLAAEHGELYNYFQSTLWMPRPKPEAILAAVIGVPPQQIWPSRFNADGSRKVGLHSKEERAKRVENRCDAAILRTSETESNAKVNPSV